MIPAVLLCAFLFAGTVPAKKYDYPVEQPVFSITFPDNWKVELNTKGVAILAQSPEEEVEYNLWPLPAKEVKDNIKAALNEAVAEVNDLVDEYVKDAKFGEWKASSINGLDFIAAGGTGKYKEDGKAVNLEVSFFSPNGKSIYVILYWATESGETKYRHELEKVEQSIKAER